MAFVIGYVALSLLCFGIAAAVGAIFGVVIKTTFSAVGFVLGVCMLLFFGAVSLITTPVSFFKRKWRESQP